jgi:hypothetical protein
MITKKEVTSKMKQLIAVGAFLTLFGLLAVINVVTDVKFDPNDPQWDKICPKSTHYPDGGAVHRANFELINRETLIAAAAGVDIPSIKTDGSWKLDQALKEANENRAIQYASPAARPQGPRRYRPAAGNGGPMYASQHKERPMPFPPKLAMSGSPWFQHE